MLYSTMTEYAIRGLSELATRGAPRANAPGGTRPSMMLEQIVAGTTLPRDFLAKVFQQLVRGGILVSSKGRGGGFALARATHEISLLDIIRAIDGPFACDGCVLGLDQCDDQSPCPQHDLFKPIRQRLKDYFQTTTLADLSASLKARSAPSPARGASQ